MRLSSRSASLTVMNVLIVLYNLASLLICVASSTVSSSPTSEEQPQSAFARNLTLCTCNWSDWMNNDNYSPLVGDNNSYTNLRGLHQFCETPDNVQCRSVLNPHMPFELVQQESVSCNASSGLECVSRAYGVIRPSEEPFYCLDYELRVLCCDCPEPKEVIVTTTATSAASSTSNYVLTDASVKANHTTTTLCNNAANMDYLLPVLIVVALIGTALLVFVVIICVVRRRTLVRRKSSKHSHHYLAGDLPRFQRPVSFTDVDNRFTEHSSLSRSSLEGSLERSKSKKLEQGRLVLNSGPRDQPDVINATPHAINPFEHYDSETPQRWLPDELSLEKQGPRGTRNNWLARPKVYLNVDDASNEHGT